MSNDAKDGQSSILSIELIGATPGDYTPIGNIMGTIAPPVRTRATNKRMPHGDTVPTYLVSTIEDFGVISLELDYVIANTSHDNTVGLQAYYISQARFNARFEGPDFVATTTDEIIHMVRVVKVEITAGDEANPYQLKCDLQPDGPYFVDGVEIGAVGNWA